LELVANDGDEPGVLLTLLSASAALICSGVDSISSKALPPVSVMRKDLNSRKSPGRAKKGVSTLAVAMTCCSRARRSRLMRVSARAMKSGMRAVRSERFSQSAIAAWSSE